MPTYHLFGADEAYTIVEFGDGDKGRGEAESWEEARDNAIKALATYLASYPTTFVYNVAYIRMRKWLAHLRQCQSFDDYQGGIRYRDVVDPNERYPLA